MWMVNTASFSTSELPCLLPHPHGIMYRNSDNFCYLYFGEIPRSWSFLTTTFDIFSFFCLSEDFSTAIFEHRAVGLPGYTLFFFFFCLWIFPTLSCWLLKLGVTQVVVINWRVMVHCEQARSTNLFFIMTGFNLKGSLLRIW